MSFAQRRLWFVNRFERELSSTYNVPVAVRLTGELDRDALRDALRDVVARHEVLRTIYPDGDGVPRQEVLDPAAVDPGLPLVEATEDNLPGLIAEASMRSWDLATDPPPAPACSSSARPRTSSWSCCTTSPPTAGRWVRSHATSPRRTRRRAA
ncbi:condensation domain-containing protein [Micromonospora sp. M12]